MSKDNFIFFEESWNIYERGTSPTNTSSDDTEGSRGPDKVYEKK